VVVVVVVMVSVVVVALVVVMVVVMVSVVVVVAMVVAQSEHATTLQRGVGINKSTSQNVVVRRQEIRHYLRKSPLWHHTAATVAVIF